MTTATTLIQDAMIEIGAIDAADPAPSNNELAYGLRLLNYMLSDWSNRRIRIYTTTQYSKALTSGTSEYTIGSGGDIDEARPTVIEGMFVRDSGGNDYAMAALTEREYRNIVDKDTSARPTSYLYQGDYALGKIALYPAPGDSSYTLYIDCLVPLTAIASLTTSVSLPPGYEEAIRTNLAIRLVPAYGKAVNQATAVTAANSLAALTATNMSNRKTHVRMPDMPGVQPGFYDIYSDSYTYR